MEPRARQPQWRELFPLVAAGELSATRPGQRVVVVNGRIKSNESCLRLRLPLALFQTGRLHIRFLRLAYCDSAEHPNHFAGAQVTPYPPLARPYQPRLAARPPRAFSLRAARQLYRMEMSTSVLSQPYTMPLLPVRQGPIIAPVILVRPPPPPPPNDDDDNEGGEEAEAAAAPAPEQPQPADHGEGGGEEEAAAAAPPPPEQPQQADEPVVGALARYVSSDDDDADDEDIEDQRRREGKRVRREAPLEATQLRATVGFLGEAGGAYVRPSDPELAEFSIAEKTLSEIATLLNQCLNQWYRDLGQLFREPPRMTIRDLSDEEAQTLLPPGEQEARHSFGIVTLDLPPGMGLALQSSEQFKCLGFSAANIRKVGKRLASDRLPSKYRFVMGDSWSGTAETISSSLAMPIAATGAELVAAERTRMHLGAKKIPADSLVFRPALVHYPRAVEFVSDLKHYPNPIERLTGRYVHLSALTDALCAVGTGVLGTLKSPFMLMTPEDVDGRDLPSIVPSFDLDDCQDDFSMRVEFGSPGLAAMFGLRETSFAWSADRANAEEGYVRRTTPELYLESALVPLVDPVTGQRVRDRATPSIEDVTRLRLHLGNIAAETVKWREDGKLPRYLRLEKENFIAQFGGAGLAPDPGGEAADVGEAEEEEEAPALNPVAPGGDGGGGGDPEEVLPPPPPPPPPEFVLVDNTQPAPPRDFVHFQRRDESRCGPPPDGAVFPEKFYLLSEEGDRYDFFEDLGEVCLAGSFATSGSAPETGITSSGFVLPHYSREPRTLEFRIYSWNLQLFRNTSGRDALVQCTLAVSPFLQR